MKILPSEFEIEKYGLTARFVEENDADFIIKLRTQPHLARFINHTDDDVEKQKEWIRNYKEREKSGIDYYFIYNHNGEPVGLNRLYNIDETSFTFGSWVFLPDVPFVCSAASAIIAREIAFDILGLKIENEVDGIHVNNKNVYKFSKMIGLEFTGTKEKVQGLFRTGYLTKENFEKNKAVICDLITR